MVRPALGRADPGVAIGDRFLPGEEVADLFELRHAHGRREVGEAVVVADLIVDEGEAGQLGLGLGRHEHTELLDCEDFREKNRAVSEALGRVHAAVLALEHAGQVPARRLHELAELGLGVDVGRGQAENEQRLVLPDPAGLHPALAEVGRGFGPGQLDDG